MMTVGNPTAVSVSSKPVNFTSKDEYASVIEMSGKPLVRGEKWYLIDSHWYEQWQKFCKSSNETDHPGPINNAELLDGSNLKPELTDQVDYQLLPRDAWMILKDKYGLSNAGNEIERTVVECGVMTRTTKVEVYPLLLRLSCIRKVSVIEKSFTRESTLETVTREAREVFEIPKNAEIRVFEKHEDTDKLEELDKTSQSLQYLAIGQNALLLFDFRLPGQEWQVETPSTSRANTRVANTASQTQVDGSTDDKYTRSGRIYNGTQFGADPQLQSLAGPIDLATGGLCGLQNLGNTCFMNSALQCLAHCMPLVEFFASPNWDQEINESNPLGMRGEIARAYADMLLNMWAARSSSFIPRHFKVTLGRFAPQFAGYRQQDSQELMAFLLDGLHEDLNRVRKKPYIEIKDADGRGDEEVADEAWTHYKMRNDSIIVDRFHGQLKSTLVCPDCKRVSVTFDPFCYLSLPLPMQTDRSIRVTLVSRDLKTPFTQYCVNVPKQGTFADLSAAIAKVVGIKNHASLVCADVFRHMFHKIYKSDERLSAVKHTDEIYVYEVPELLKAAVVDSNKMLVCVYNRCPPKANMATRSNSVSSTASLSRADSLSEPQMESFGIPFVVAVKKPTDTVKVTRSDVYAAIQPALSRFSELPAADGSNWFTGSGIAEDVQDESGDVEMRDVVTPGAGTDSGLDDDDENSNSGSGVRTRNSIPPAFKLNVTNIFASTILHELPHAKSTIEKNWISPVQTFTQVTTPNLFISLDWHPWAAKRLYRNGDSAEPTRDESCNNASSDPSGSGRKRLTLHDCLDLFTTKETLSVSDPWYCGSCKDHKQATKEFQLWRLPEILIIQLKRFTYNRFSRDKIETFIDYPIKDLDLTRWIQSSTEPEMLYDLIAVSNHYGGLGGGHYTATALHAPTDGWYYFDDSRVSRSDAQSACSAAGYILVYRRRQSASDVDMK